MCRVQSVPDTLRLMSRRSPMRKFTLATSVALLLVGAGASPLFARGGKKESSPEMSASMNKQFDWENKVVGPKEGLDHDKVAATRERGIREEQERKAKGPEKVKKVVADPSTATIPTQDIEKPAAPVEREKKVAAAPHTGGRARLRAPRRPPPRSAPRWTACSTNRASSRTAPRAGAPASTACW